MLDGLGMWKPVLSVSPVIEIFVFMVTLGFRYVISVNFRPKVREPRSGLAEYMI